MAMPPRGLVLLLSLALSQASLDAQVSKAWAECRGDSLSTWNCARYYSGTATLSSTLKGDNVNDVLSVTATVTAGKVACRVKGTEVGEYEGPGMIAVEHETTADAGEYKLQVWCPERAGDKVKSGRGPTIMATDRRAADYTTLEGKDSYEHPLADAANGLTGTETITWQLRRQ